jgi:ABC-type branched-subunit amino acid transport system ATPase component
VSGSNREASRLQDSATAAPILEAAGLSKRFGGLIAVDGISFSVARGSALGIIGPNGAGKTTLFNLLSGFETADSGVIRFEGRPIQGAPPHRIARLGIGRTFQSVRVFGALSVRENLRVAHIYAPSTGTSSFDERLADILDFVGLTRHADATAGNISYGQRKLVELGMVLMARPSLILLDEPVAGVNPALIEEIVKLLSALIERGQTLLVVEHNIPFVTRICGEILVMANGGLLVQGTGAEIQRDPRVLEAFLGAA